MTAEVEDAETAAGEVGRRDTQDEPEIECWCCASTLEEGRRGGLQPVGGEEETVRLEQFERLFIVLFIFSFTLVRDEAAATVEFETARVEGEKAKGPLEAPTVIAEEKGNEGTGGMASPEQPTVKGAAKERTPGRTEGGDRGDKEGESEAIISEGTETTAGATWSPGS